MGKRVEKSMLEERDELQAQEVSKFEAEILMLVAEKDRSQARVEEMESREKSFLEQGVKLEEQVAKVDEQWSTLMIEKELAENRVGELERNEKYFSEERAKLHEQLIKTEEWFL